MIVIHGGRFNDEVLSPCSHLRLKSQRFNYTVVLQRTAEGTTYPQITANRCDASGDI